MTAKSLEANPIIQHNARTTTTIKEVKAVGFFNGALSPVPPPFATPGPNIY